jgi:hypothetical protein
LCRGFHTQAAAMCTPALKATTTQRRCSFVLTRDATVSRCGTSTPRRVSASWPSRRAGCFCRNVRARVCPGLAAPQRPRPGPRRGECRHVAARRCAVRCDMLSWGPVFVPGVCFFCTSGERARRGGPVVCTPAPVLNVACLRVHAGAVPHAAWVWVTPCCRLRLAESRRPGEHAQGWGNFSPTAF